MRQLIFLFLFLTTNVYSQQYHYFGTSYNTTQMAGGPIYLDLIVNPDNSIIGMFDSDPYPGQGVFCGAGNISGTIEDGQIFFQYTSNDPDPDCGFDWGFKVEFQGTIASDFSTIVAVFTIYEPNGTFHSSGNSFLRKENECADIAALERDYQSKVGTPEALYSKQYLCLAQESCLEYNATGDNGWGGGFVKFMFDYIAKHNQGKTSLDLGCNPLYPSTYCFAKTGVYHVVKELAPAFFSYCDQIDEPSDLDKWTDDHEKFLTNAVAPCFDKMIIDTDLCSLLPANSCAVFFEASKKSTIETVRILRKTAQAYCVNRENGGDIFDLLALLPDALTRESLMSNELDQISEIDLKADQFFLEVGKSYQLTALLKDDSKTDVTSSANGTEYVLSVDNSIATISADGMITVHNSDMPLVNAREPIYVFVTNGEKTGIGQFAIYGLDSDQDLIIDAYEEKVNLDPMTTNYLYYDADSDGLSDFQEVVLRTNPLTLDSDADSFSDPFEVAVRSDPLDPSSTPISITTDVKQRDFFDAQIDVFPNPFDEEITMRFSDRILGLKFYKFSLMDVSGRSIKNWEYDSVTNNQFTLTVGELPIGVYFLKIKIDNQIISKKLVKLN